MPSKMWTMQAMQKKNVHTADPARHSATYAKNSKLCEGRKDSKKSSSNRNARYHGSRLVRVVSPTMCTKNLKTRKKTKAFEKVKQA